VSLRTLHLARTSSCYTGAAKRIFSVSRQDLIGIPHFAYLAWRAPAPALVLGILAAFGAPATRAEETTALYRASWAGVPAGQIRLSLRDTGSGYRNEIAIRTEGLAALFTRFRGSAASEGTAGAGRAVLPAHYDAFYDLRKNKDRRLSMRFVRHGGMRVAERGPDDTSSKPPLPEKFRQNVLDPLSVIAALRQELRAGHSEFTLPVYDGSRRFDMTGRTLPKATPGDTERRVELMLRPIAGFKGETSDDGDPDSAPRPVDLAFSDDPKLMPLRMQVSVSYLPLIVEFAQWCQAGAPCGW